jgi:GNAT superfamily N-acetyltransferase
MQGARQILAPFSPYSVFVYYEKDKPLTAIEIFASDSSTLGIFSLSTLEAHRGRGIGTALMKFVLYHAKEAGFRQAVLQASQDGIGIYQRLGFSVETHFSEWH